jgi:phenylacetate-CoA ligase
MSLTHQLFLQRLREVERFPAPPFDAYRGPLLAGLIDHAWREVPGYRDCLSRFVEGERFNLESWIKLPLLRAVDLEHSASSLQARTLRPPADEIVEVAPSAEMPICRRSALSLVAAECERELLYEMWGLDLSGSLAILHPDQPATLHGRGWSITFTRNSWIAGPLEATPKEQLQWLAATGVRTLRTNAALVDRLADAGGGKLDTVIISDIEVPPRVALKIAEAFGAKLRHLIEWPLLGVLAAERDDGTYAVPAASNAIEIVDQAGWPVTGGQTGELVVSPLYEFAAPLLRFATGIAAVMPHTSQTVLGTRSLGGIKGRVSR